MKPNNLSSLCRKKKYCKGLQLTWTILCWSFTEDAEMSTFLVATCKGWSSPWVSRRKVAMACKVVAKSWTSWWPKWRWLFGKERWKLALSIGMFFVWGPIFELGSSTLHASLAMRAEASLVEWAAHDATLVVGQLQWISNHPLEKAGWDCQFG